MSVPKAHDQHEEHAAKAANRKHEPGEDTGDGGARDASQATPKGYPTSERHQTETATKPAG